MHFEKERGCEPPRSIPLCESFFDMCFTEYKQTVYAIRIEKREHLCKNREEKGSKEEFGLRTILVVDDSMIIRITLKKIFEKAGYEVVGEAINGREAVEKYSIFRPDLVTMDTTMPEMDGIEALEEIRSTDPSARVVMISALGQERKIIEAVNKGAMHFIVKPFQEKVVLSVVERILDCRQEVS